MAAISFGGISWLLLLLLLHLHGGIKGIKMKMALQRGNGRSAMMCF